MEKILKSSIRLASIIMSSSALCQPPDENLLCSFTGVVVVENGTPDTTESQTLQPEQQLTIDYIKQSWYVFESEPPLNNSRGDLLCSDAKITNYKFETAERGPKEDFETLTCLHHPPARRAINNSSNTQPLYLLQISLIKKNDSKDEINRCKYIAEKQGKINPGEAEKLCENSNLQKYQCSYIWRIDGPIEQSIKPSGNYDVNTPREGSGSGTGGRPKPS